MLKSNLASLQSAALSKPVPVSRQMSTPETDVTNTTMMPAAYHYPIVYTPMGYYEAQTAGCAQIPAPTVIHSPVMPVQHPGVGPIVSAATSSPVNLVIPVTGEALQYSYTSESLYRAYQAGVPIYPAPAQPNTYPQDTVIYAKPVDQFDVRETSNWVRLLGETYGWSEAAQYAEAFFQQRITGLAMSQLSTDTLESVLNIKKLGHRLTLMNAINALYNPYGGSWPVYERRFSSISSTSAAPSTTAETIEMSDVCPSDTESEQDTCTDMPNILPALKLQATSNSARRRSIIIEPLKPQLSRENLLTHDKHLESITLKPPQLFDTASSNSLTSDNSMGSCVSASSQATSSSCTSSIYSDRKNQLTLTLRQIPLCNREAMWNIKTKFATFGYTVHPRPSETDPKKFFIRFVSEAEANRALLSNDQLKMDLTEYTETSRRKGPRPTPSNPQRYMVLHHARMRTGKSMRSNVVGFLKKGEVHWVNQIKGKRARITKRDEDGDRNLGWVSLRNNAGYQLLAAAHE